MKITTPFILITIFECISNFNTLKDRHGSERETEPFKYI